MYCQRHGNSGVLKTEVKFLQFWHFLPIYPILSIKLTIFYLTELKVIYYLGLDTFQRYCSFTCCMTFIFIKNHENKIILGVLGFYWWLH